MTLRDRCRDFLDRATRRAVMRVGSPVDELVEFVVAEQGRAAGGEQLDDSYPLCLYFDTPEDRREFIEIIQEAKPTWRIGGTR